MGGLSECSNNRVPFGTGRGRLDADVWRRLCRCIPRYCLIVAQGHHGIDLGGAARWNITGGDTDEEQAERDGNVCDGVSGAYADQETAQNASHGKRSEQSDD